MYPEFETRISHKYLKEVIKVLEEPICILGGWAVFFHVNKKYKKVKGRNYLGSRDIDLGFHLDKNATTKEMENSSLAKSLDILENKLKFKPISFRLLKEFHTETSKEIKKNETIPSHFTFPLYVDPLVDFIPKGFKKVFHFQPADEPLLRFAFENAKYRDELKEFNKKLWLPKPELLLATKLNALMLRDLEHKKIKDICDIFALMWYSGEMPTSLRNKVSKFIPLKTIKRAIINIKDDEYKKASINLDHSHQEIRRVIEILIE